MYRHNNTINLVTIHDNNFIEMINLSSEFGCNEVDNCHENADCIYDQRTRKYTCECMDGFSGDGFYCTDSGEGRFGPNFQ